jgi:hypothetical protein
MQNLIRNFFARPISGVESNSKLIRTKFAKNWRYNGQTLPNSQEELQSISLKLNRQILSRWNRYIFKTYDINKWVVEYALDLSPYSKNCRCLLPGCQNILTDRNRQKLANDCNYFFIKTHNPPFLEYFDNEYVLQIVRHPSLVFESYFHFLSKYINRHKTLDEVIMGQVPYGSWSDWHQQWERAMSVVNGKFLRLRFEDILLDTLIACQQIKELIGLDYDSTQTLTSFSELKQRDSSYYRSGDTESIDCYNRSESFKLLQKLHAATIASLGYE